MDGSQYQIRTTLAGLEIVCTEHEETELLKLIGGITTTREGVLINLKDLKSLVEEHHLSKH